MKVTVRLAQMRVSKSVDDNASKIISVLNSSFCNDWVVFPEGALSWYSPDDSKFVDNIDFQKVDRYLQDIKEITQKKKLHVILGTVVRRSDGICNSAYHFDYKSNEFIYDKFNLGGNDRSNFREGNDVSVFEVDNIKFGMQICRDSTFPEPWRLLKKKGAQIVFHLNNAIRETDIVRKNILITRAFENQFFVCSANNSHEAQVLPSMIVNPKGEIVVETQVLEEVSKSVVIDTDECMSYYVTESRLDIC